MMILISRRNTGKNAETANTNFIHMLGKM